MDRRPPPLTDEQRAYVRGKLDPEIVKEEQAKYDKPLKVKRTTRKHERMIHDSSRQNTYVKEKVVGIEGLSELSNQGDPGDETTHIEAPETDEQPGTPGDGGHEVSTGSPDDPTQPDQTNEPAEGLQVEQGETGQPAEGLNAVTEPVEPTHPPTTEDLGLLPDATPQEIREAVPNVVKSKRVPPETV